MYEFSVFLSFLSHSIINVITSSFFEFSTMISLIALELVIQIYFIHWLQTIKQYYASTIRNCNVFYWLHNRLFHKKSIKL